MSKDYSHIKPGMCVPTMGMDRDTYLELVDAFRAAGFDMGYRESDWHLLDKANYYGVDTDGTVMQFSCADSYTEDNGECVVTVDFILNGPKTSSEALQDTLEEKATEVLAKVENGLESNTERLKLIGKIVYTKQYPNDGAITESWDSNSGRYYGRLPWQDKDSGIYFSPEDIGWVEEYQDYVNSQAIIKTEAGASVNISVLVFVQGNNYQLSRDQAYKLWEDLTEIFEEKIV